MTPDDERDRASHDNEGCRRRRLTNDDDDGAVPRDCPRLLADHQTPRSESRRRLGDLQADAPDDQFWDQDSPGVENQAENLDGFAWSLTGTTS